MILEKNGKHDFGMVIRDATPGSVLNSKNHLNFLDLLLENKLLILKNFQVTCNELHKLAKIFGKPEAVYPAHYQVTGFPNIRLQSNVSKLGIDYVGMHWHADGLWHDMKATLLSCIDAPLVGGETMFANMVSAYNGLQVGVKKELEAIKGFPLPEEVYLKDIEGLGIAATEEYKKETKELLHPVSRKHPITGEKSLYISDQLLKYIEKSKGNKDAKLLENIYKTAVEESRIYTHKWDKYDLLIWDNTSLIHKAQRPSPECPKTTWRITTQLQVHQK